MKVPIITAVAGLLLLGLTWAPTIYTDVLNHSFPVTPTVTPSGTGVASLVPSQQQPIYGAFFRDLAVIVKDDTDLKTTDQLLAGAQYAAKLLKTADNLPDDPTFSKAVSDRLATSVGLTSKPLDTDTRNKFADTCNQIASELGVK